MASVRNVGLQSKRVIGLAAILLACACLGFALNAGDPADLVEHVEKVRTDGMTEAAREDLGVVASIRTGEKLLQFIEGETPGAYIRSYTATSCELPGTEHGRVAQLQAALLKTTREDRDALRAYADGDGSGFVSTAEAADFRDLIELGYLAAWMIDEHGASLDRIATASSLSREETEAKIARYNDVAKRLNAATRHRMPVIRPDADG